MKRIACRYCFNTGGHSLYNTERFPSIYICIDCLGKFQVKMTQLMGEEFIQSICDSTQVHVLRTLSKGPLFQVSATRHFSVKQ